MTKLLLVTPPVTPVSMGSSPLPALQSMRSSLAWSLRARLGPVGKGAGLVESKRADYANGGRLPGSRDHQSHCAKTRLHSRAAGLPDRGGGASSRSSIGDREYRRFSGHP